MIVQVLLRFLIGGALVMIFSALGDVLRPKSFAGLFGAAPSIALATLALTIADKGAAYAAVEARSMMIGAAALLAYAWLSSYLMLRRSLSGGVVTTTLLGVWLVLALSAWMIFKGPSA